MHHLFKAEVEACLKNQSFVFGRPKIEEAEHVHFFHTINSVGTDLKYTNSVGGHYHEIEWSIGEDGEPVAKCGPAICDIPKKPNQRMAGKRRGPVQFYNVEDNSGSENYIKDDHSHNMRYIESEMINIDANRSRKPA